MPSLILTTQFTHLHARGVAYVCCTENPRSFVFLVNVNFFSSLILQPANLTTYAYTTRSLLTVGCLHVELPLLDHLYLPRFTIRSFR